MAICEVCGNEYDQSFELWLGGETHILDAVECAFYEVAPRCACCERRIVGRGIETGGIFFCCAHCAREYQAVGLQARAYPYVLEKNHVLGEAFVSAGERL